MNFIDRMMAYYQNESVHGGFIIGAGGLLLLCLAVLAWKFANPLSFLKGLTIPLMIAGLFFGIAGAANGYYTKKSFAEKLKVYQHDHQSFFKAEVSKVEKIHKSWLGVRISWTLVALSGLSIIFLAKRNFMMGVGTGILFFGLIAHVVEAFSFSRNEKYMDVVIEVAQKEISNRIGQTTASISPVVRKMDFKQVENRRRFISRRKSPSEHKSVENDFINMKSQADSLNAKLTNSKLSVSDNQLGDTTLWHGTVIFPGPFNNAKAIEKEKTLPAKGSHCWLSKRFVKN